MPCFVAQSFSCGTELRFGSLCNLGLSKTLRFSLQRHKTQEFGEAEFSDCLPVSSFASENSCFRNSHEQKLQNSAKPNSGTVRRFSPLIPAVWGFGLGLLRSQGFIGAKASLDPLCRAFLAAFATLVCQRNCVFLCKGTKPENSAKPNSRTVCRFSL